VIYEQKFTDKFADQNAIEAAMNEWGEALNGLTDVQIQRGLATTRRNNPWPPSIAEFYQAAITYEKKYKVI
jgi:hypothetical protein